jgi:hypothetical protein
VAAWFPPYIRTIARIYGRVNSAAIAAQLPGYGGQDWLTAGLPGWQPQAAPVKIRPGATSTHDVTLISAGFG